jgi:hypothetical protein
MAYFYKTISGSLTQELIKAGSDTSFNSLRITNTTVNPCKVDLILKSKSTGRFFLIKDKLIKASHSIVLEKNSIDFNNKSRKDNLNEEVSYSVNIKLTDPYGRVTPNVDILIN